MQIMKFAFVIAFGMVFYNNGPCLVLTGSTVFDLISGLSAYVILGPKNRPN